MFCGIFDGHGSWGHFVAKKVREWMPSSLLCNWQETLAQTSLDPDIDLELDKKHQIFNIWKQSYVKTCAAVDQELERHRKVDSFHSGTTALTIVRQVSRAAKFLLILECATLTKSASQFAAKPSVCSLKMLSYETFRMLL